MEPSNNQDESKSLISSELDESDDTVFEVLIQKRVPLDQIGPEWIQNLLRDYDGEEDVFIRLSEPIDAIIVDSINDEEEYPILSQICMDHTYARLKQCEEDQLSSSTLKQLFTKLVSQNQKPVLDSNPKRNLVKKSNQNRKPIQKSSQEQNRVLYYNRNQIIFQKSNTNHNHVQKSSQKQSLIPVVTKPTQSPHQCEICGKSYSKYGNYVKHINFTNCTGNNKASNANPKSIKEVPLQELVLQSEQETQNLSLNQQAISQTDLPVLAGKTQSTEPSNSSSSIEPNQNSSIRCTKCKVDFTSNAIFNQHCDNIIVFEHCEQYFVSMCLFWIHLQEVHSFSLKDCSRMLMPVVPSSLEAFNSSLEDSINNNSMDNNNNDRLIASTSFVFASKSKPVVQTPSTSNQSETVNVKPKLITLETRDSPSIKNSPLICPTIPKSPNIESRDNSAYSQLMTLAEGGYVNENENTMSVTSNEEDEIEPSVNQINEELESDTSSNPLVIDLSSNSSDYTDSMDVDQLPEESSINQLVVSMPTTSTPILETNPIVANYMESLSHQIMATSSSSSCLNSSFSLVNQPDKSVITNSMFSSEIISVPSKVFSASELESVIDSNNNASYATMRPVTPEPVIIIENPLP